MQMQNECRRDADADAATHTSELPYNEWIDGWTSPGADLVYR
jgi:hypothetical protein